MEKIDIQNFNKYYLNVDGNATVARVGHVNAVIEAVNNTFDGTAIDPTLNGGMAVSTDFGVDLPTTAVLGGVTYQGYKLAASAVLNDPATDNYFLFLGAIKVAPGTQVRLGAINGTVYADASLFIPTTIASVYSPGAEVVDPAAPFIYQLDFADIALQQNPSDLTEYAVLAYLESTGNDFNAELALDVTVLVTYGATFTYSRS